LVTVALSNKNTESKYHHAVIDMVTGKCVLDDKHQVDKKELFNLGFHHPLIIEQTKKTAGNVYYYEYNGIDGLLQCARYVYSSLLQAGNPAECNFKISPSSFFEPPRVPESIYLSIDSQKHAQECISTEQLEQIVAHISGYPFTFLEGMIIDEEFTMQDLPKSVDGDSLYTGDIELLALLKAPFNSERFELRYISPGMGFGVFTREVIKKGENIFFYGGVKKNGNTHDVENVSYAFDSKLDCLKMFIDAREYGNIARFVNHAPNPGAKNKLKQKGFLLEANVNTTSNYLNGIEVVVFTANKDISKGEQLLVDYGSKYFKAGSMNRFKLNGKLSMKIFKNKKQKQLADIRVMANHGVQKAQQYLLFRMLAIVAAVAVLMGILKWSDLLFR